MQPDRNAQVLSKLVNARTELLLDWPFFGYMALRLELKVDPACKEVWTNGVVLGANPDYVLALTKLELMEAIAHLILHLVSSHHLRQGGREHERWQRATDHAIASLLLESVYRNDPRRMPKGMYEKRFAGMSAEWIYQQLLRDEPPPPPPPPAAENASENSQEDDGAGQGGDQGEQSSDDSGPQQDDGTGDGPADETEGDGNGAGDGEGSQPGGTSQPPQRPEVRGEVRPLPAEQDRDEHKSELNATMAEAAMSARGRGLLPAGIEIAVDKELESKVDWRSALRMAVNSGQSNPDYRMDRPNRRMLPLGLYLPSLVGQSFGLLGMFVDTSASVMAYKLFDIVMGEVSAIREELRPDRTLLLECDAKVHRVQELYDCDDVKPNFRGGGGTSFEPCFEWIDEQGEQPEAVIYFTDLECPFPEKEPPYPVIWLAPEGRGVTPPFGTLIEVPF